jgi:polysaccharide chain length determinant protein (PEP-CTERM system associated)
MSDVSGKVGGFARLLVRRRWLVIAPLVLCTGGAAVALRYMPKVYRSTTVILVQAQSIPTDYVKPTVTSSVEQNLKTIQQQVTSRTRLEGVIQDLKLFPPSEDPLTQEQHIAQMRTLIDLEVKQDKSFTLSYRSEDPVLAARVANRLADVFIEENARGRRQQAKATSQFLAEELDRMSAELTVKEGDIAEFKRLHQEELPTQQDANLRALEGAERSLRDVQMQIERARDRKTILEAQRADDSWGPANGAAPSPDDPRVQLRNARAELAALRERFTDRYPEVQRLQAKVQELEERVARIPALTENAEETSPVDARLQTEIRAVDMEISHLETEEQERRADVAKYGARSENAPRREQELLGLTRDYESLKQNYQALLRKKQDAQLAESLEAERQGEQFVILDRARPPAVPFRPDPLQVIGLGLMLGLALGAAWVAAAEALHPTFSDPQQLRDAFAVPVLAAVPIIRPPKRARGGGATRAALWLLFLIHVGGR